MRVAGLALALSLGGCRDKAVPEDTGGGSSGTGVVDTGEPIHDWRDPLSTPESPTVDLGAFSPSSACVDCHPTHVEEWSQSVHAHAMTDPVFRGLVAIRSADLSGEQDAFCTQCHSNIGTRGGDISPGFDWAGLDPVTLEGVTCESCHRIQELVRDHNAGHRLDPEGPMRGPIEDFAASSFHETEAAPWMADAAFCGTCHDVNEVSGLPLERPYAEWLSSPAGAEGRPCQTCHMPESAGVAAVGGAVRTVHDHRFPGVDVPDGLDAETTAALRERVGELLAGSGTILLDLPEDVVAGGQLDVVVTVRNELDAHNLPTGSTYNRQLWVEVLVHDAAGELLYETGTLDADGDLRDHWSALDPYGDDDLIALHSDLIDADGQRTRLTHVAVEHRIRALQPLHERTWTLFAPVPGDAVGPLTVSARLRFRPYGPHLFRLLEQEVPELVITDIDADAATVGLR